MADQTPPAAPDPSAQRGPGPQFPEFLSGFSTFVDGFARNAANVVDDPDIAKLVGALGSTLGEVIGQLRGELLENYRGLGEGDRQLMERQLRLSGGTRILDQSIPLTGQMTSRLSAGSIGIIAEIVKKIIRMIFELFGNLPRWLEKVLEIIDNIIKAIVSFLHRGAARMLHVAETQVLEIRRLTREMDAAGMLGVTA